GPHAAQAARRAGAGRRRRRAGGGRLPRPYRFVDVPPQRGDGAVIDFLRGRIVHREPDYVVLEVRDVGYRVFVPNPYALGTGGEPVVLYVHHHIREDAMML